VSTSSKRSNAAKNGSGNKKNPFSAKGGVATIVLHEPGVTDGGKGTISSSPPIHIHHSGSVQPQSVSRHQQNEPSPKRDALFHWQDEMEERAKREKMQKKQFWKERDGFCRRVDAYDGQVITVESEKAYELGNYLGGGVAGVVYEGHRLRPIEEYPVRLGRHDSLQSRLNRLAHQEDGLVVDVRQQQNADKPPVERISINNLLCFTAGDPEDLTLEETADGIEQRLATAGGMVDDRVHSLLSEGSATGGGRGMSYRREHTEEMALEATASKDRTVMIDTVDAPSRSKHYAQAVAQNFAYDGEFPAEDASFTNGMMEETVAIKVLNPVGFRTLAPQVTNTCVVARDGDDFNPALGIPMEDRHVWWLVNPNSRNLRTLQRYSADTASSRPVKVDRGSAEKGLRISLIAAYKDQRDGQIRELPLTRCIEIWGHVPFGASDAEFTQIMTAIDKINSGQPPPPLWNGVHAVFDEQPPGRVGTGGTTNSSLSGSSSNNTGSDKLASNHPMTAKRT